MQYENYGLNRYICTVLDEMRKCVTIRHFSVLPSLIEEAQILVNRMEGKLYDIKDLEILHTKIKEKKLELKTLEKDILEKKHI